MQEQAREAQQEAVALQQDIAGFSEQMAPALEAFQAAHPAYAPPQGHDQVLCCAVLCQVLCCPVLRCAVLCCALLCNKLCCALPGAALCCALRCCKRCCAVTCCAVSSSDAVLVAVLKSPRCAPLYAPDLASSALAPRSLSRLLCCSHISPTWMHAHGMLTHHIYR